MPDQTKVDTGTERVKQEVAWLRAHDDGIEMNREASCRCRVSADLLESLAAERDDFQAQLAEARAVVERLDKTEDGKPVVTGDTVYRLTRSTGRIEEHIVETFSRATIREHGINWDLSGCYSTPELAAEAARDERGNV
jgi:hypothetical protein